MNESCSDRQLHADVVLVLDASTSMLRMTSADRPKLNAALEAAAGFVALMDFTPNEEARNDQVALVGFNDSAWIQHTISADRSSLEASLSALPERVAQGTRLDLALDRGVEALADPARREDNMPVIVLLTDGLPNRVPTPEAGGTQDDSVRLAAERAKDGGVTLFTIGLGDPQATDPVDRINADLLRDVASSPERFYQTPNAEDLAEIYGQIAVVIRCPPGRHDWTEPWP